MIVAAAIRLNGKVYLGMRHNTILHELAECGVHLPIMGEQGFVDDTGVFLDRHEAGLHAIACDQISAMCWPGMGLDSSEVFPRSVHNDKAD